MQTNHFDPMLTYSSSRNHGEIRVQTWLKNSILKQELKFEEFVTYGRLCDLQHGIADHLKCALRCSLLLSRRLDVLLLNRRPAKFHHDKYTCFPYIKRTCEVGLSTILIAHLTWYCQLRSMQHLTNYSEKVADKPSMSKSIRENSLTIVKAHFSQKGRHDTYGNIKF